MKSRIWEKREGKYETTFAKIQVTAIFFTQDMRRNVLPKFIEESPWAAKLPETN